jgi:predicted ATPase
MKEYEYGILDRFNHVVSSFFQKHGIYFEREEGGWLRFTKNGKLLCMYDDLSDGQRRFLYIMVKALRLPQDSRTLLLIDTPETFLHTSVQRILIESIRKINPNIQLLITTHSPGILMNGGLNWIVNMSEILTKTE